MPKKGSNNSCGDSTTGIEVWIGGKRIKDIGLELQTLGNDYIVATAMEGMGECDKFPAFEKLDLEQDIMTPTVTS